MPMLRYDFLRHLHEIIKPEVYLEVGVQTGASLALAERAGLAIGIDPEPVVTAANERANQRVYAQTADEYFACTSCERPAPDFAYIDGSHLFEDALRDFANIERRAHRATVVAFDDVLPYSQSIAVRPQVSGDWTGDVWKVAMVLRARILGSDSTPHPWKRLSFILVDVAPTGLLLVTDLVPGDGGPDWHSYRGQVDRWINWGEEVPDDVIAREFAHDADIALDLLAQKMETLKP